MPDQEPREIPDFNESLMHMRTQLARFHIAFMTALQRQREEGASLVEYALLLSLIALACFAAVTQLGGDTGRSLSTSGNSIITAN